MTHTPPVPKSNKSPFPRQAPPPSVEIPPLMRGVPNRSPSSGVGLLLGFGAAAAAAVAGAMLYRRAASEADPSPGGSSARNTGAMPDQGSGKKAAGNAEGSADTSASGEAKGAGDTLVRDKKESAMSDNKPNEPKPSDFKEAAERSQDANIADESAAYTNASQPTEGGSGEKDSEAHPS